MDSANGHSETQISDFVFSPSNWRLVRFLEKLQRLVRNAYGLGSHVIIEQFIYANMPPQLKKSFNQARLENGGCEQIVKDLEQNLELNHLEGFDELRLNTVSQ